MGRRQPETRLERASRGGQADGATIAGPVSTTPTAGKPSNGAWQPYGCLIDANGTLGQDTNLIPTVAALQTASAAQASQLGSLLSSSTLLGGRVDELFDLRLGDRRDAQQGIAAAVGSGVCMVMGRK